MARPPGTRGLQLEEPVIFERGQPGNRGPKVPRAFPAFFRDNPGAVYAEGRKIR